MGKGKTSWLKHWDFLLFDLLFIEIAYLTACAWRHGFHIAPFLIPLYIRLNIILIAVDVVVAMLNTSYKNILKRGFLKELQAVIVHNSLILMVLLLYIYLTKQAFYFSRSVFIMTWILSIIYTYIIRFLWKKVIRKRIRKGVGLPYMLVVTYKACAPDVLEKFRKRMYNSFNMAGLVIIDDDMKGQSVGKYKVVCNMPELTEYLRTHVVDEVLWNAEYNENYQKDVKTMIYMGISVHIGMDYLSNELPNKFVERIGGFTVVTTAIHTMELWQKMLKRLVDIAAGLVGVAMTGVLFLFLAPAIKKESPGPAFYCQERVGRNGRVFKMYKFRSMCMDAEKKKEALMDQNEMQGQMFKIKNDPRIIGSEKGEGKGIGNFIRKTSLDEFPQFWNILKGDMSLVGTRPPTLDEYQHYEIRHKVRLSIKPGLTGLWQVSGRNRITDFEEIVKLDEKYIENWSLKEDMKIIMKTVKVVLARKGAE